MMSQLAARQTGGVGGTCPSSSESSDSKLEAIARPENSPLPGRCSWASQSRAPSVKVPAPPLRARTRIHV